MFDLTLSRLSRHDNRSQNQPVYAAGMSAAAPPEQSALVALLRRRPHKLTSARLTDLVLERGSAVAVLDELSGDMLFAEDQTRKDLATAAADIEAWQATGVQFWTILDAGYPARVRDIVEAPPFLLPAVSRCPTIRRCRLSDHARLRRVA